MIIQCEQEGVTRQEIIEINHRLDDFQDNTQVSNELLITLFSISLGCWGMTFAFLASFVVYSFLDAFKNLEKYFPALKDILIKDSKGNAK
ncbi:MAG: hypothetical protein WAN66_14110 [Limnoraphis robusta]|uniref:Uncharacterized protein n=1 Tax=Limnoraphis robusta CS-951 TaxID=1637645 RepID=A0A0F5YIQ9_9CYAN|nr:hypothetical protein [Limnoraphis robusta]KKD38776.1 hypothetical protein WN50_06950 [Limnoraphis robusta CS-951]